jgi:putative ABC transport system permease protein
LLVIERIGLFATLKALGVPNRRLLLGLMTQGIVVAALAFVVGASLTLAAGQVIPAAIPLQFQVSRALVTGVLVLFTALVGSAITFRRIARIEPASAIS